MSQTAETKKGYIEHPGRVVDADLARETHVLIERCERYRTLIQARVERGGIVGDEGLLREVNAPPAMSVSRSRISVLPKVLYDKAVSNSFKRY